MLVIFMKPDNTSKNSPVTTREEGIGERRGLHSCITINHRFTTSFIVEVINLSSIILLNVHQALCSTHRFQWGRWTP